MPDFLRLLPTPVGAARVSVVAGSGRGLLCLGHGAGGGVDAPDLVALRDAALAAGWTVARVEQPYRVAGRRAPAPAPRLDAAWLAVVEALRASPGGPLRAGAPLVVGGRSSGARVACRTAGAAGAAAVVCLAFPLVAPSHPGRSRVGELLAVDVPVLVVQGERDRFGGPDQLPPSVQVVAVPGDHSLRTSPDRWTPAVIAWLQRVA